MYETHPLKNEMKLNSLKNLQKHKVCKIYKIPFLWKSNVKFVPN